jgi:hypothetical protein
VNRRRAVALLAAFVALVVGVTRRRVRRAPPDAAPQEPNVPESGVPESGPGPLKALQLINLEQPAKILAGLGLFLYILGLLNVNGYLFAFGVTDFSLIRTRFIYTGVLIASSAFVCALPLFVLGPFRQEYRQVIKAGKDELAKELGKQARRKRRFRRWIRRALFIFLWVIAFIFWVLGVVIMLAMPGFLLYQLYLHQFSVSDVELVTGRPGTTTLREARLGTAFLVYLFGLLVAWNVRRATRRIRKKAMEARVDDSRNIALDVGAESALFLASIAVYCLIFMTFVYPIIPQQYGGGRPQEVSLLFKDDAMRGIQQLRVPLQRKGQQISAPLALVHETDDIYVVRLRDKRVLRIDKDLVSAVVNES